ncbi:TPA: hypothetical protein ACH3X1_006313 [Trebouxia sp. C0004]
MKTRRDGALIRKCSRGEANKVVAAAAQAARATAPSPPRQQQAQEPRATVAMDPSALLHQHGISLDQLSDPSSVVAQAAQAFIADFDNMMCVSDDDVAVQQLLQKLKRLPTVLLSELSQAATTIPTLGSLQSAPGG